MRSLSADEREVSAAWVAAHQRADGAIPWLPGRKMDPWDHVQCAMCLTASGRHDAAKAAFRYLAQAQGPDGAWPAASTAAAVLDPTRESNHAAYLATGLWHLHRSRPDPDFLAEMWPTLDRAMAFVIGLQDDSGAVWWAVSGAGAVWPAALLTGSSSVYGSLVCAVRIAQRLGHHRPGWERARDRLGKALREEHEVFSVAPGPDPPGRFAMDWYYPVLGGAMRGTAAQQRLQRGRHLFIGEGIGCRCVYDSPWYTVAETCELVIALDTCGLTDRAHALFEWTRTLREADGGYWMGITYPENMLWPPERPSWTTATVIMAADTLAGDSPSSHFFRELGDS